MKKRIALIGSTGSIGTQALEVIRQNPELFEAEVLTAQTSSDLLIRQAIEFRPNAVVIGDETHYNRVSEALRPYPVKVFAGNESLSQVTGMESIDLVLNAMVGFAGLQPTLSALDAGKDVALANKESLVVAGDLIMKKVQEKKAGILPVDSEHSAIFQCLAGETGRSVEKIILTASGGPFRGKSRHHLVNIKKEAALKHPKWKMGDKITIDSASLMNKGLEVIEARWLFGLAPEQIDVVVHPQSIIHSMVQFIDGSIKAQMGVPDMKLPILYALGFPDRISSEIGRIDFNDLKELVFEPPDRELFRSLGLAYEALEKGGNMPCILNAANEAAVQAFLEDRISFLGMPVLIEKCMNTIPFVKDPSLDDYTQTHRETVVKAAEFLHISGDFFIHS